MKVKDYKEYGINEKVVEAVKVTIQRLKDYAEIKRDGIIIECRQDRVNTLLFATHEFDVEQLRRMRNNYVFVLANMIDEEREKEKVDYDKVDEINAIMTIVTGTIDNKIWKLGGQV